MPLIVASKDVALTLKQVVKDRKGKPQNRRPPMGVAYDTIDGPGMMLPGRRLANLRGYVCIPKSTIPGAKQIGRAHV